MFIFYSWVAFISVYEHLLLSPAVVTHYLYRAVLRIIASQQPEQVMVEPLSFKAAFTEFNEGQLNMGGTVKSIVKKEKVFIARCRLVSLFHTTKYLHRM